MKGSENLKKCDYCAKEISYFEQYCSEECHGNANKYYETTEKYGKLFSIINMICFFGIPIGIFLFAFLRTAGMIITVASCDILGIMLILLPFPTENMISKYKLKKATKITRIIGLAVIGPGFMFLTFMILFPIIFPD
mgnify:FL=1